MKSKILIIGQAPPAVKQEVPYDTTMLYDWLIEVGITKDTAQDMFEFEAVCGDFTGFSEKGGHRKPSLSEMDAHWDSVLEEKVQLADKIILLGNVSRDYFYSKPKTYSCGLKVLELIHPSKRNSFLYSKTKDAVISSLKEFINS